MILELDLHLLYKSNLTPNQFIFCQLINEGHYLILQKLIKETKFINNEGVIDLLSKEYIVSNEYFNLNNFESTLRFLKSTEKFKKILPEKKDDPFEDLLSIYPAKIIRPDGSTDYLRTALKKCKIKYNNIVKRNASKHKLILSALEYELNIRKKENKLSYMKRLPKWLDDEEWQVYAQRMEDDKNKTIDKSYGGDLL